MSTTDPPVLQTHDSAATEAPHNSLPAQVGATKPNRRPRLASTRMGTLGKVPQWLLNLGFVFALVLSGACLFFSAVYLYNFLTSTNAGIETLIQNAKTDSTQGTLEVAINGRLVMARIALLSCGILVGVSFGFLGFALFLLGIKQSMDVDLDAETYKGKFARMSPGVLVIVCSAILTGICATRETPFWYDKTVSAATAEQPENGRTTDNDNNGATKQKDETGNRDLPSRSNDFLKP